MSSRLSLLNHLGTTHPKKLNPLRASNFRSYIQRLTLPKPQKSVKERMYSRNIHISNSSNSKREVVVAVMDSSSGSSSNSTLQRVLQGEPVLVEVCQYSSQLLLRLSQKNMSSIFWIQVFPQHINDAVTPPNECAASVVSQCHF